MQEPGVIFEDEIVLVINKPSGMVVNRAASVKGVTVQGWVEESSKLQLKTQNLETSKPRNLETVDWDEVNRQAFWDRAGIVHRLDKETSGILLVAKTEDVFVELLRQFREREVKKTYWALGHGEVQIKYQKSNIKNNGEDWQVIDAPVGRLPWNRERFGVLVDGRSAVTRYRVIKEFQVSSFKFQDNKRMQKQQLATGNSQLEIYTLIELEPLTGRTHQIRIHLKHIGHPIVGDEFYAGRKTAREDRKWCPRIWLHARSLEFTHPRKKKRIRFEAELPDELEQALEQLTEVEF